MTKNMKSVRRQSFTLVEVIAVLLVIAILAAVAAPKFVNMANEARNGVAKAGINEAKATLSVAYAKAYLALEGTNPSVTDVLTNSVVRQGLETFGDIVVNVQPDGTTGVTLTAVSVKTVTLTDTISDTWTLPNQN